MSDLSNISETQVLYADAGYDPSTGKPRLLEIVRKLSMRKVFEVVSVTPVTERQEHTGVAVLEFPFYVSVGTYRQMVAEASQGSFALASATFNVPMDLTIDAYKLEDNVEDTSASSVQKRRSEDEFSKGERSGIDQVSENRDDGAKEKDKSKLCSV